MRRIAEPSFWQEITEFGVFNGLAGSVWEGDFFDGLLNRGYAMQAAHVFARGSLSLP